MDALCQKGAIQHEKKSCQRRGRKWGEENGTGWERGQIKEGQHKTIRIEEITNWRVERRIAGGEKMKMKTSHEKKTGS